MSAKYLVLFKLDDSTEISRIAACVPEIQEMLKSVSSKPPELVFQAERGRVFAYLILSGKNVGQLRGIFAASTWTRNSDSFLILEIGEGFFASLGFTRLGTWIQHN